MDEWMQNADGEGARTDQPSTSEEAVADEPTTTTNVIVTPPAQSDSSDEPRATTGLLARRQANNPGSPEVASMNGGIDMPGRPNDVEMSNALDEQRTRTETPDGSRVASAEAVISGEGPLTPRNNAGPFVFDGSAGRGGAAGAGRIVSVSERTEGES
jgi:hypothetical protein